MKQFISFVNKENKHILRDRRTMMILFGMPIVMMLLFGFAISTDVKNVRTVIVCSHIDFMTDAVAEALNASSYFTVVGHVPSAADAERMMRNQQADMAIVFSSGFAASLVTQDAQIQILADASDPNMAVQQTNYAMQIITQRLARNNMTSLVNARMLYNPQMKSSYNFVPGIMGMLLLIICAMMTSVSIVREKERGTMEVLLVSPIRPLMIIVAKAVPYFVLSLVITVVVLLISHFVLYVPLAGSLVCIFAVSMLYILLALSLGLLISIIATGQLMAILFSGMVLLLPSILLSGMIFPIESMPAVLRAVTFIIPARWFISAMRKLMIMGVDITTVGKEVCILAAMTAVLLATALLNFKKRLE